MIRNPVLLRRLRLVSIVEGVSTLLLFFVAMPLKYLADMPMAVTIVGSVHGALFVGLCVMFVIARQLVPLPDRLVAFGIFGAVVPFGPFVVDRHLVRLDPAHAPAVPRRAPDADVTV